MQDKHNNNNRKCDAKFNLERYYMTCVTEIWEKWNIIIKWIWQLLCTISQEWKNERHRTFK